MAPKNYTSTHHVIARLQAAREALRWSQAELARRSGVEQSQISKLEKGKATNPSLETVVELALAMGVGMDLLLGIDRDVYDHSLRRLDPPDLNRVSPDQLLSAVSAIAHSDYSARLTGREDTTSSSFLLPYDLSSAEEEKLMRRFVEDVLVPSPRGARLVIAPHVSGTRHDRILVVSGAYPESFPKKLRPYRLAQALGDIQSLMRLGPVGEWCYSGDLDGDFFPSMVKFTDDGRSLEVASSGVSKRSIRTIGAGPWRDGVHRSASRRHARTLELLGFPATVENGWLMSIVEGLDVVVSVDMIVTNPEHWLRHADAREETLRKRVEKGNLMNGSPEAKHLAMLEDMAAMKAALRNGTTRLFNTSTRLTVRADTAEGLDAAEHQLRLACGGQLDLRLLQYQQNAAYTASLPAPGSFYHDRVGKIHSQGLMTMLAQQSSGTKTRVPKDL